MLHTIKYNDMNLTYHVIHLPSFGKLEYKTEPTYPMNTFTQKDINEGILFRD